MTPEESASALAARRRELAEAVTRAHFLRHPELDARYGAAGREKCREDAEHHLHYLEQALRYASPELFADYVGWAKSMLESRGIPQSDLEDHLRAVIALAREAVPAISPALDAIASPTLAALPVAAAPEARHDAAEAGRFLACVREDGPNAASALVSALLDAGWSLQDVYVGVLEAAQHEVGRLWQLNRITVAEEHYYTAATQLVMSRLYPKLFARPARGPRVVIACVAGELHEIGARMVADVLQLEGFDTYFLGASVPTADLVRFVRDKAAAVLGLSATIPAHLGRLDATIRAVRDDDATRRVKVVVGGSPFGRIRGLWKSIGGDACARDARDAVEVVRALCGAE